jgi:hypothetical protein
LRNVGLELQQLKLDLEVVILANVPRFVARLADLDGILEALEVLLRQIQSGLGELNADELRGRLKGQRAFVIGASV